MPGAIRKNAPASHSVPVEDRVPLSYLARALHEEGSKEIPSVVEIWAEHAAKGGDLFDHLVALLCLSLMPHPPFTLIGFRTLKTHLTRCESSVRQLLELPDLPVPLEQAARQFAVAIRKTLKIRMMHDWGASLSKKLRGKGAPKGPTRESLVAAIIAKEFRRRFGRPCYKEILALLRQAAPDEFPASVTTHHIEERIRSVPDSVVEKLHAKIFSAVSKAGIPR